MVFKFLYKYGLTVAFGVALLASLIGVFSIKNNTINYPEALKKAGAHKEVVEETDTDAKGQLQREVAYNIMTKSQVNGVGSILYWALILTVVGGLSALAFPLIKGIKEPKSLIKVGSGILGLFLLYFIGVALSDDRVKGLDSDMYTASGATFSGAIVFVIVLLIIVALGSIVFGEVVKTIKERR